MLQKFYLTQYRFKLVPHKNLRLSKNHKGITLRGAFGSTFKKLCCHDFQDKCRDCPQSDQCPYSIVFEPTVPAGSQRLSLNRDIPRPFIIKPPLDSIAGNEFEFDLVIIGRINAYLPYFIASFAALGAEGMGTGRNTFSLEQVSAIRKEEAVTIYSGQDRLVRNLDTRLTFADIVQKTLGTPPDKITLKFLTPAIIKAGGELIRTPEFHHLIKRLRDRVNALAHFYCGETMDVDFKEYGDKAEAVRQLDGDFQWQEVNRYSTKRHIWHELSGFTGSGTYEGDLAPYLPLLALGEYVHVGKGAAFGNGWLEVA